MALKALVDSILATKHEIVQTRRLAIMTGTVLSMHLSWGPVTQLYSRTFFFLDRVGVVNKLLGGCNRGGLERAPFLARSSMPRAQGRNLAALEWGGDSDGLGRQRHWLGGGHTMQVAPEYAHE